jgi:hypothetical protein
MTNKPERGNSRTILDCGGKRSATPLFFAQLRGFANQLALKAPDGHTAVEKAPSSLRFAGAVKNALVEA